MAKDFIDELMEALQNLKNENNATMTPAEVLRVVMHVAKHHRLTADEMSCAYGFREPTGTEFRQFVQMLQNEREEA